MSNNKLSKMFDEADGPLGFLVVTLFAIAIFVAAFTLLVGIQIYYGWAVSILWSWFVVTKFGLPAIDIWHAAGLMLLVSAFRVKLKSHEEAGAKISGASKIAAVIVGPPMMVGFGWLLKYFGGL